MESTPETPSGWKTETYHGVDMHVRTTVRAPQDDHLPGHGQEWDFVVRLTEAGGDPESGSLTQANSDANIAYSTQAIAENMGFIKGRELAEGRAAGNGAGTTNTTHATDEQASRSL